MALTRAVTSAVDAFAARLAYMTERIVTLERSSHRHNTPQSALQPVGTVVDFIGTTAPPGWILLQGQTLTNAITEYPTLWNVVPASMKSGNNIILPDARNRVIVGRGSGTFSNQGATGGVESVTLTAAQSGLVGHAHPSNLSISPADVSVSISGSTGPATGNTGGPSNNVTTSQNTSHTHFINLGTPGISDSFLVRRSDFITGGNNFRVALAPNSPPTAFIAQLAFSDRTSQEVTGSVHTHQMQNHTHPLGGHGHSFSGSGSASHGHTLSGSIGPVNSANAQQAHTNLQPYLVLTKILKVV